MSWLVVFPSLFMSISNLCILRKIYVNSLEQNIYDTVLCVMSLIVHYLKIWKSLKHVLNITMNIIFYTLLSIGSLFNQNSLHHADDI